MAIRFIEKTKTFMLETKHTTYQMKISKHGHLLHTYYGESIPDEDMSFRIVPADRGFSPNPYEADKDRTYTLDVLPQEFSSDGVGDYRKSSVEIQLADGSHAFCGTYTEHNIYPGKAKIKGLPCLFANDSDHVDTLEITLTDPPTGVYVVLAYSVFEEKDVITRNVTVVNENKDEIALTRIMSCTIDFLESEYDFVHFDGRHCMERQLSRTPLRYGVQSIESCRGASSHQHNPFAILCDHDANEDHGDCYGFCFVYSGNFRMEIERDQFDQTRVLMGINPRGFRHILKSGEFFSTPEVVLSYSPNGFTGLTHQFHDAFRDNLIRSKYAHQPRPVLINSWEAAYFDFDEEKLLGIAKSASEIGVDMFVLDDGWFGKRDSDFSGLGDWKVNRDKLSSGLAGFADKINALGLKFGLWVEPEMISEDSDLYRSHPDWVLQIEGRRPSRGRYQLLLDFSQKEVCDYIIESLNHILDNAHVEYIKWDFNRNLADVWSSALPGKLQGEVYHRYILGLYRVFDEVILTHPDVIFCGCAGGGGRYDAGMLYYNPEIWCSDNTDAINRLKIQYGTSFIYPANTMEAHVSVCPNHQTNRTTPFNTRGVVASAGILGYELDATKLSDEEKAACQEQIQSYRESYDLIAYGDYYRLTIPDDPVPFMAWQYVAKDGSASLASLVITDKEFNAPQKYLRFKGLVRDRFYYVKELDRKISGMALMKKGIPVPVLDEYEAIQYHLEMM